MGKQDDESPGTISPRWVPVAPSWLGHRPEDIPPKSESVRKVNPPERLAAWDARWPRGAER